LPVLDRDAFASVVVVPCIRVPAQQTSKFVGVLQANGCLLERRAKVVVKEAQSETRLILLREDAFRPGDALPKKVVEELKLDGVPPPQVASHNLSLGYDDKSAHEILQAILPPAMEVPTSFETIGHIAHLNLPEAPPELDAQPEGTWAAHKRIIGQVILDKNPCIRTVVNKVGVITNEFRVFDMEVLAGEHNLVTEISQHGVRYRLDYSKTYWNSRLETEHRRLVDRYFREGEMILDLMCGVGPFALPAAKKGCKVIANDLNKHSVHWLLVNARLNNIDADSVVALNMDAREVVRFLSESPDLKEAPSFGLGGAEGSAIPEPPQATPGFSVPQGGKTFDHVVMNLPRNALEFLDIFKGSFAGKSWADRALPQIHVYTFMNTSATDEEVREQIEARVGGKLDEAPDIHTVRMISPRENMLCVSFRFPEKLSGRHPLS